MLLITDKFVLESAIEVKYLCRKLQMSIFRNVKALDVVANSIVIQEDAKRLPMRREQSSAQRVRSRMTRMQPLHK
jgi:hypothetical protein